MLCLLRFLGFRWIAATWCGFLITLLVRALLSAPPDGIAGWPYPAVRAGANAVTGSYQLAFGLWLFTAAAPLKWLVPWKFERAFDVARSVCVGAWIAGAVWSLIKAVGALSATPTAWWPEVLAALSWVTLAPLGLGLLPWLLVEVTERLRTFPVVWRWFYAGRGAHSTWIAPYELRRLSRPIPRRLR